MMCDLSVTPPIVILKLSKVMCGHKVTTCTYPIGHKVTT